MFTGIYETRYGDYKDARTVKISSVLDMVQDAAVRHSEARGYSPEVLAGMKLAWFIRGIKARFDTPVKTNSPVTVNTGIKQMRGLTSKRCCIIEQNGKPVAKTIADWFLFNTKEMCPCKVPDEILAAYELSEFDDEFFSYKKPVSVEAGALHKIVVSNKEIDTNRHLNNQKSTELLMDALPFDYSFTDMTVLFKQSAYLGDELELCVSEIENGFYSCLRFSDGAICVEGTFQNL